MLKHFSGYGESGDAAIRMAIAEAEKFLSQEEASIETQSISVTFDPDAGNEYPAWEAFILITYKS